MTETNKPVITIRDRAISASVFKRQRTDNNGNTQDLYGVCLQRSYKKQGDNDYTREQINLFPDDLLRMAQLLERAYGDIVRYIQDNRRPSDKQDYPAQSMGADSFDDDIPF